jgi:hypothetical protein
MPADLQFLGNGDPAFADWAPRDYPRSALAAC